MSQYDIDADVMMHSPDLDRLCILSLLPDTPSVLFAVAGGVDFGATGALTLLETVLEDIGQRFVKDFVIVEMREAGDANTMR